jgi:hypothetical protein
MEVITDAEVLKFLSENEWNHGIKADGTNLYYDRPGASCIKLKFPESPRGAAYFAQFASRLGIEEESQFCGALLWITYSTVGSLDKAGWKLVERMRQGYGENRSLQTASGHWFRSDEMVELTAFVVPCFVFGWDAYIVPSSSNDFFIHISHDEYWGVVARTQAAYDEQLIALKDLNPKESSHMRKRFCQGTNA